MLCPPGTKNQAHLRGDEASKIKEFRGRKDWTGAFAYLDDYIRNNRDNLDRRRQGFATTLQKRAKLLRLLGQTEQATTDEKRADALSRAYVLTPQPANGKTKPQRYVDIVPERKR